MSDVSVAVKAQLAALVEPLLEQLGGIEQRLAALDAEREELTASKRQIERVVNGLQPSKPKKHPSGSSTDKRSPDESPRVQRQWEERIATVQRFIEGHEFADGIVASQVSKAIASNGGENVSPGKVRTCLEELHNRGVLRVDRKINGGGVAYKLVGQ